MNERRLDQSLVERNLVTSRHQAQQLIRSGNVLLNQRVVTRSSAPVKPLDQTVIKEPLRYVSRAGYKLEAAFNGFSYNPQGKIALDVGASTGGFTDCLLQNGVDHVYAVDVGHGQFTPRLKDNPRVTSWENTDIRHLPHPLPPINLAVVDVSFISLKLVIPHIVPFLSITESHIISLLKPQFETGRPQLVKKGIVRSTILVDKILKDLFSWFSEHNLTLVNYIPSPITGWKGNQEYLVLLKPSECQNPPIPPS